ncbi:NAD-dependent dehydratase [Candidatus Woesearchaeota archaeon]|nr:MAG: NAD-dependent dehydratase [Candidatus Woesearchaeota archaeon]
MKVLVCGAGGFIGGHLAKFLYKKGLYVIAVDIKWDGFIPEPFCHEKITGDLREFEVCDALTKGVDWVFQLAADMGGIGYITQVGADIMKNNALININMLEASTRNGVKRFFFSSSACVYPEYKQLDPNVTALKEEDAIPAQPDQFYGWEKLFTEKLCEAYKRDKGLDVRVARFHNIYGPYGVYEGGREKAPAALCRKVALARDGDEIEIWGDGKQTRSFCYIDDCVEGIWRLMNSDYDQPLNIGSDELVTIEDLAKMIIEISGKKLRLKYDLSKPQGVRGRNSDNTKIKQVLGWAPSTPLKVGIERTYRWIEQHIRERLRER